MKLLILIMIIRIVLAAPAATSPKSEFGPWFYPEPGRDIIMLGLTWVGDNKFVRVEAK